jgi:tryptophanyl-tRNA synthetase
MPLIDPWGSRTIKDYNHVFREFGLSPFPKKWASEVGHRFFSRGIIVAHRDFQKIMRCMKQKKPFINVTGIASSGQFHLGHKADIDLFLFFKEQGARNYFCICDLDGYLSRPDNRVPSLEKAKEIAVQNAADALALGIGKDDIRVQGRRETRYYEFTMELSKKITKNMFEAVYGHLDLGKVAANLLQYSDILHGQLGEFEGKMPSITGIGLDQDPHARLTRDLAKRLPYRLEVPSFVYFRHQSGLKEGTKMSASQPDTAIFLSDSGGEVSRKIANAFTGGGNTAAEQRKFGGKPSVCKVYELLLFHFGDEKELKRIWRECRQGKWLCKECKQFTTEFILGFLKKHQRAAANKMNLAKRIVRGKH